MAISTNERLQMLQSASQAWIDLRQLLDEIPDAALRIPNTVGTWRGQDVIIHLANWNEEALNVLDRYAAGQSPSWPLPEGVDNDVWNEERLAPWRTATPAQARKYLNDTYERLMHKAETMRGVRPNVVLGVTVYHFGEHMDDLRKVRDTAAD